MAVQTRLPKVLIASHECSGAQFLLDSLASNFGYHHLGDGLNGFDEDRGDRGGLPSPSDTILAHLPGHWSSGLLKSYYEFGFYADWLRSFSCQIRIIYIVRDVLPVMRSLQRYLIQPGRFEGPRVTNGSDFIRTTPAGAMLRYQHQHARTMVHRWANHVHGWLTGARQQSRQSFTVLRFESLHEDFESTMHDLAIFLDLPLPTSTVRPQKLTHTFSKERSLLNTLPSEVFRLTDCDLEFIENVTQAVYQTLAEMGRPLTIF